MNDKLIHIVNQEFKERARRNPNYSMRAFAKQLGVNPTSLSLYMNETRKLSPNNRRKIIEKLVGKIDTDLIHTLYFQDSAKPKSVSEIDLECLKFVADWYYFAILSLMETDHYQDTPEWFAKRLNLKVSVVEQALMYLEKFDMIKRNQKGKRVLTGSSFQTPNQISSLAVRKSHFQALDLAKISLSEDDVSVRSFNAMTMAIDPTKICEANKRITKFNERLCKFLESGKKVEVYRLSVQLFPLSKS